MEEVAGVDVSWMRSLGSQKDSPRARSDSTPSRKDSLAHSQNANGTAKDPGSALTATVVAATPISIPVRPNSSKNTATERSSSVSKSPKSAAALPSPVRRNSWLSSFSSKFSGTQPNANSNSSTSPLPSPITTISESSGTWRPGSPGAAITQQAAKDTGEGPQTNAPPKAPPSSFLQSALRRLSSSSGASGHSAKGAQHGICERRVLNVDRNRERCHIPELEPSKLRRVAFCVDVEIASGPRYLDDEDDAADEKARKDRKKSIEKGEGAALKGPVEAKGDKKANSGHKATSERNPHEVTDVERRTSNETQTDATGSEKDTTKKKEKKKRSEEERKARKERRRRNDEMNGKIPCELVMDGSDSDLGNEIEAPKPQHSPTLDPTRIYRRCCQLRETPILKRITEQLALSVANAPCPGVVKKLDLTGYSLQLPDLVTLGDYLAVVPVKELILEDMGLTDEGIRVVLSGLLAAKLPIRSGRRATGPQKGIVPQGGVVERLVLKNNPRIGRDGWRHICLFINLSRSLKSLDLSKIPIPQTATPPPVHSSLHLKRTPSNTGTEVSCLLAKAIGERLAGDEFELLNMAECAMNTEQLGGLIDGVTKSGLRRLGLAGNDITAEGLDYVIRWICEGNCEGLDLGGNNLKGLVGKIADALDESNKLYALSLADCGLNPDSLWTLFPALTRLKNFRFIDLSQNHGLFASKPSALSCLRRYLPKLPNLKRIHLTDVSMTPEQAIALAEILPEAPSLHHVNIMSNVAALADAKTEASKEEACALYASLMAAVQVSKTIFCIDIEVPSSESSEIVKALAKQVVAYCLYNMERGAITEISQSISESSEREVPVPDVLLHIVGHVEGCSENHDSDEPAPDQDYVIGGTGVVKALGICLRNRGNDSRRPSADRTFSDYSQPPSRSGTPVGAKAKDVSKHLLNSARKIRNRLQPAMAKESCSKDLTNYHRLQFLDLTLQGMVERFENEFPETRLDSGSTFTLTHTARENSDDTRFSSGQKSQKLDMEAVSIEPHVSDDEGNFVHHSLSRRNSDVSLASRALGLEEGRMHKWGQELRRSLIKPDEGLQHENSALNISPYHLQLLRDMVKEFEGKEIRERIEKEGTDSVIAELSNEASALRSELKASDPEGWRSFVESQQVAQRNQVVAVAHNNAGPGEL